jgi:ribosomal protein S18 acetylase RimI-like enzyme
VETSWWCTDEASYREAVHVVDHLTLPAGYTARPYAGRVDHPAMVTILRSYREHGGDEEMPTVEQFDLSYGHLEGCDPTTDIGIVEHDGEAVAYVRAWREDVVTTTPEGASRDLLVFTPTRADHLAEPLFGALTDGVEAHMRPWASGRTRLRAAAPHPGPDEEAVGEAAWLEARGYVVTEWSAQLVRPHLDDIPERTLPDGVELRPVRDDQVRTIIEHHLEAFRGEWDFHEPTEADIAEWTEDDDLDVSLWKVAWAGDTVVGQVKSYINHDENRERGYLRGYTEDISTHADWRNRGIAGALLAMSLSELRSRGMTEAALGVDTNNPGGAFHLYTSLGFELRRYEAVYTKPVAD